MIIYFAASAGRIKIGSTRRAVEIRLKQIGQGLPDPLELIGVVEGPIELERASHAMLAEFRLRGEWFKDIPEVRSTVGQIIAQPSVLDPFIPKRPPKEAFVSTPPTPENRRAARKLVLEMMWQDRILEELTALSGAPPETVLGWLSDQEPFPPLVRWAMQGVMMEFFHTGIAPTFLDPHELNA